MRFRKHKTTDSLLNIKKKISDKESAVAAFVPRQELVGNRKAGKQETLLFFVDQSITEKEMSVCFVEIGI